MIYHTDCLKQLKKMKSETVDSIVTDPPYGINIFDSKWDKSLPSEEVWQECHRVLRPGGLILSFSSSRKYHHLAVVMEKVGFQTQNMLSWIYNISAPKGHNLARELDRNDGVPIPDDSFRKYLRDAIERSPYKVKDLEALCGTASMFRHYLSRSQACYPTLENWRILKKALKLDNTYDALFKRIEKLRKAFKSKKKGTKESGCFKALVSHCELYHPKSSLAKKWNGWKSGRACLRSCIDPIYLGQKTPLRPIRENVKRYGVGGLNIGGCWRRRRDGKLQSPSNVMHDGSQVVCKDLEKDSPAASLSFSEFFCVPKVTKKEKQNNTHPTVKPLTLMRHLVRLVTPKGGRVLDPFAGSGTTGVAAKIEGMDFIGMEKEKDFFKTAKRRLNEVERMAV